MSILYQKINSALTESELKVIDEFVMNNEFPWYYQNRSIPMGKKYSSQSYPFACHNLMLRHPDKTKKPGQINSNMFEFFYLIFKRHCLDHSFLLRMSLNLTFYHNTPYGDIHVDHDFEHNNFILYLNTFSNGNTYLFDNNHNIIEEIPAVKNTGCIFPGLLHAQGFCDIGQSRLILVATYI